MSIQEETPKFEVNMSDYVTKLDDGVVLVYDCVYVLIDGIWFETVGKPPRVTVGKRASVHMSKLIDKYS